MSSSFPPGYVEPDHDAEIGHGYTTANDGTWARRLQEEWSAAALAALDAGDRTAAAAYAKCSDDVGTLADFLQDLV